MNDFYGQTNQKIYEILSEHKFVLELPRAKQVGLEHAKSAGLGTPPPLWANLIEYPKI